MKKALLLLLAVGLLMACCAPVHPTVKVQDVIERAATAGAEAVILRRSAWLVAENAAWGPYTVEVTQRTQVLTQAGARLRKIAVPVPDRAELEEFEGRCVQPDGRTIDAGPDSARIRNGSLAFELPMPDVGAVLEYHYRVRVPTAMAQFRWDFQSSVPVARSVIAVNWPKWARLGYQVINAPSGQSIDPDVRSGHGPGIPDFARIMWTFVDLSPTPPGRDRTAIVLGLKDLEYERRLAQREGWGAGFPPPTSASFLNVPGSRSPYSQSGTTIPSTQTPSHRGAPINKH
jgi:hypothetical protein